MCYFVIEGAGLLIPSGTYELKFEAVEAMSDQDQLVIVSLIDAYIKKRRLEELAAS